MANSNVVYYKGASFEDLRNNLNKLGDGVCKIADNMIGDLGSEARKVLGRQFERRLHMGEMQTKWKTRKHGSGYDTAIFSRMDGTHGWYKGISNDTRLIGFKYENVAYQKGGTKGLKAKIGAESSGYVQSIIANLFAQPIYYPKGSPYMHRWSEPHGIRWKAEYTRPAYITMTAGQVQSAVNTAIPKTEKKIKEMLIERGFAQ